jgi:hypothetical protein
MPEICRFFGIVIKMYFLDHAPPHFHVETSDQKAKVDIQTLEVIDGELSSRVIRDVRRWAEIHRDELMDNWMKSQRPETLDKIEPLD